MSSGEAPKSVKLARKKPDQSPGECVAARGFFNGYTQLFRVSIVGDAEVQFAPALRHAAEIVDGHIGDYIVRHGNQGFGKSANFGRPEAFFPKAKKDTIFKRRTQ